MIATTLKETKHTFILGYNMNASLKRKILIARASLNEQTIKEIEMQKSEIEHHIESQALTHLKEPTNKKAIHQTIASYIQLERLEQIYMRINRDNIDIQKLIKESKNEPSLV